MLTLPNISSTFSIKETQLFKMYHMEKFCIGKNVYFLPSKDFNFVSLLATSSLHTPSTFAFSSSGLPFEKH